MPRDWDAATYDRLASPMARWGEIVVGWLVLAGDESVLDAGCGTGRVTERLLERLPRGWVVALDGSHWITDHDALFSHLAGVLRPGGQLAARCGGAGNISSIETALRDLGEDFLGRKHFATPEATRTRLEAAGFIDAETWLQDEPTELAPEDLETYLATICLGDHVESMTEDERERFVHEVAIRLPGPRIDYVRLNIRARLA